MLEELSPAQAFELMEYAAMEPFGEVRADLRMAHAMLQAYDIARGKSGRKLTLGEFTLYADIAEASRGRRKTDALTQQLNALAAAGKRKKNGAVKHG